MLIEGNCWSFGRLGPLFARPVTYSVQIVLLGTKITRGTTLRIGGTRTDERGQNPSPPDLAGNNLAGNNPVGRSYPAARLYKSAESGRTTRVDGWTKVSTGRTIHTGKVLYIVSM